MVPCGASVPVAIMPTEIYIPLQRFGAVSVLISLLTALRFSTLFWSFSCQDLCRCIYLKTVNLHLVLEFAMPNPE